MYTVDEVRKALQDEKLSEALYKLERFAQAEGLTELAEWCSYELNGHSEGISLSDETMAYRFVSVQWIDIRGRPITLRGTSISLSRVPFAEGVTGMEAFVGTSIVMPRPDITQHFTSNVPIQGAKVDAIELQSVLDRIRIEARRRLDNIVPRRSKSSQPYPTPDFAKLVPDADLADIFRRRWDEANRDFEADAYLSTVIMLGSILEGVLLSKVEQDKPKAFSATSCPKRHGTPIPIEDWKLQQLIEVTHECGWLRTDVKAFSHVLRDYRNFVHPNKERQEGITFDVKTARITWEVVSTALDV